NIIHIYNPEAVDGFKFKIGNRTFIYHSQIPNPNTYTREPKGYNPRSKFVGENRFSTFTESFLRDTIKIPTSEVVLLYNTTENGDIVYDSDGNISRYWHVQQPNGELHRVRKGFPFKLVSLNETVDIDLEVLEVLINMEVQETKVIERIVELLNSSSVIKDEVTITTRKLVKWVRVPEDANNGIGPSFSKNEYAIHVESDEERDLRVTEFESIGIELNAYLRDRLIYIVVNNPKAYSAKISYDVYKSSYTTKEDNILGYITNIDRRIYVGLPDDAPSNKFFYVDIVPANSNIDLDSYSFFTEPFFSYDGTLRIYGTKY
ncbi:MAG: hypothetical protein QW303_04285, partial [Nitrososphaerota archaeon]